MKFKKGEYFVWDYPIEIKEVCVIQDFIHEGGYVLAVINYAFAPVSWPGEFNVTWIDDNCTSLGFDRENIELLFGLNEQK